MQNLTMNAGVNLDSWIVEGILLTNIIFLACWTPGSHIKYKMVIFACTSLQNNYKTAKRKTSRKSTITFNYWIVDGNIEFPCCMQVFDKSNELQLENTATWSNLISITNSCI